jgi:hypothetical protein
VLRSVFDLHAMWTVRLVFVRGLSLRSAEVDQPRAMGERAGMLSGRIAI